MFGNGLPVHPLIVHLPMALAVLIPILSFGVIWWVARSAQAFGAWKIVIASYAILIGTGLVAMKTGENEEAVVENRVAESLIEDHEERAEIFLWIAGFAAALAVGALFVKNESTRRTVMIASAIGSLAVAGAGAWTGHAGGELVYKHGAAAAYAQPQGNNPQAVGEGATATEEEEDDD
jgi:uncharacterized membrane protein